jgi:hypothetical protein
MSAMLHHQLVAFQPDCSKEAGSSHTEVLRKELDIIDPSLEYQACSRHERRSHTHESHKVKYALGMRLASIAGLTRD